MKTISFKKAENVTLRVQYIPAGHPEAHLLPEIDADKFEVFHDIDTDGITIRLRGDFIPEKR